MIRLYERKPFDFKYMRRGLVVGVVGKSGLVLDSVSMTCKREPYSHIAPKPWGTTVVSPDFQGNLTLCNATET